MSKRKSKFRVIGRFDMASRFQEATVVIDRGSQTFNVRPLRRRKVYSLPLSDVASIVVQSIIKAEVREKLAAEKAATRKRFSDGYAKGRASR